MQRARHILPQYQQLGDSPRRYDVAVDLAIGLEARHRPQQRAPLVVVYGAADFGRRWQQRVVLDVEYAGSVVAALDVRAEADEVVAFIAQHGAESYAPEQVRAHLDPAEELGNAAALDVIVVLDPHLQPRGIEILVHFGRDRAADRPSRFSRRAQAAEN